jgi:hypothetical protein
MAQGEMVSAFDPRPDTHPHQGHRYYARPVHRYRQRDRRQTPSLILQRIAPFLARLLLTCSYRWWPFRVMSDAGGALVGGVSGFERVMSTVIGSRRWLRAGRRRCAQLGLRRVAIALPVAACLTVVGINDYVVAGRLLIPVSAILDLRADLAGHDLAEVQEDILEILDEVGPQPQPVIAPSVWHALHAAG